jgi:hypothetical protein
MASDPQIWAELRSSAANWLNRDDLDVEIPEFIGLAERHFNRVLTCPEREATSVLVASADTVPLPADFEALRAIHLSGNPLVVLDELAISDLRRLHAGSPAGRPRHFTVQGAALLLAPAPSAPCNLVITYQQSIPALGEDRPSNWLLAAHPDLYLAGTLLEAFLFLRDDREASAAMARRDMVIASINAAGERKRHNGPLVRRSATASIRNIQA